MNSGATEKLREIVNQYGPSIIEDHDRCEGLLRDYCIDYRRELSVLVSSLRDRVPNLLSDQKGVPQAALRESLIRQLQHNLAMDKEAAEWAVNAWSSALGPKPVRTEQAGQMVYCPDCNASNPLPREARIEQSYCMNCGQPLVQTQMKASSPPVWKIATLVLFPLLLLSVGGCAIVFLMKEDTIRSLNQQVGSLQSSLQKEKSTRQKLAESMPVSILKVTLQNQRQNGTPIGNPTNVFITSAIRFIGYQITLQNNFTGIKDAEGTLGVKYIDPQTGLITFQGGPTRHSYENPLRFSETGIDSRSLGREDGSIYKPGNYRIEFYWNGQYIGEKPFTVTADIFDWLGK